MLFCQPRSSCYGIYEGFLSRFMPWVGFGDGHQRAGSPTDRFIDARKRPRMDCLANSKAPVGPETPCSSFPSSTPDRASGLAQIVDAFRDLKSARIVLYRKDISFALGAHGLAASEFPCGPILGNRTLSASSTDFHPDQSGSRYPSWWNIDTILQRMC